MSAEHEIQFRMWVYPKEGDSPYLELWHYGLEPTSGTDRSIADWAREAFWCLDPHEEFELDPAKHWQVIGKARLSGSYCNFTHEFDEELDIYEFEKAEVPESWLTDDQMLVLGDTNESAG